MRKLFNNNIYHYGNYLCNIFYYKKLLNNIIFYTNYYLFKINLFNKKIFKIHNKNDGKFIFNYFINNCYIIEHNTTKNNKNYKNIVLLYINDDLLYKISYFNLLNIFHILYTLFIENNNYLIKYYTISFKFKKYICILKSNYIKNNLKYYKNKFFNNNIKFLIFVIKNFILNMKYKDYKI